MPRSEFAQRPGNPKGFRFTARDGQILEAIHAYDGMLSPAQIVRICDFNPSGQRQALRRLHHLWAHGYVKRPNRRWRAALGEMVYFLDKAGARYVAGLAGQPLSTFKWRSQPRWSLIPHDLWLNDFRIDVEDAVAAVPEMLLEDWITSGEFWSYRDAVAYTDLSGRKRTREVKPDAYFAVTLPVGEKTRVYRFLVELDMNTEHKARIGRDKVLPGLAYAKSGVFRHRCGPGGARFLFVTSHEARALSMKHETERSAEEEAYLFYFTWFDQVRPETVFEPIWYRGGTEGLVSPLAV